jgi:hypothetical protein
VAPPRHEKIPRSWPVSSEPENQQFQSDEDRYEYLRDKKREDRLRRWAARSDWRRRALRPGAWVFVVAAATEAVGLGLQAAEVPDSWWGDDGNQQPLDHVVAIVAAIAVVLTAVLAAAYGRLLEARKVDRRLEELAKAIAREVCRQTDFRTDNLGVHVWELHDPRVWLIPRWIPHRPHARHLGRRAAFIPERREHEAIAFMEGVGVVGRCWERRREVIEDLGEMLTTVRDAAAYYSEFGYRERYRLSFAHLWNTRHFWTIWAYPIFVGPPGAKDFGGAVTVDYQRPGGAEKLQRLADNRTQELDSLLADCAALLRGESPVS